MWDDVVPNSRGSKWQRVYETNITAAAAAFVSGGLNGIARSARNSQNNQGLWTTTGGLTILDFRGDGAPGMPNANHIIFKPFGTDTNDQTFSIRLYGIEEGSGKVGTTQTASWEPTLLCEIACTLGNVHGLDGSLIATADFVCDTVAITSGPTTDTVLFTTTDIRGAWFRTDIQGFPIIGIEFDDAGSAATMNALYRLLW